MENKRQYARLFDAILSLKSEKECAEFFEDLCTIKELNDMRDRLDVAQHLIDGETYETIGKKTKMSSATISRVNRCIQYGTGGYRKILGRIK